MRLLASFSDRATREEKLRFMFMIYDVDRDDRISRQDLETILRHLVGSALTEEQIGELVQKAFAELAGEHNGAGGGSGGRERGTVTGNDNGSDGIGFEDFERILCLASNLATIKVPLLQD